MEKMWSSNQKVSHVLPVISPRQQVQFIQAILILVGVILGNSVSQWFYMFDILAGISFLIASLSGSCLLEGAFAKLPWNQPLVTRKD